MIDLRSDTVTKPTPGMLQAMVKAEVGDDVFGEDPTVNRFEEKMAAHFGMEAGLFVPSGTMSNQLCLNVLTQPGDEVIIDELGHVFNYETGAAAHLSSIQLRPVKGTRGKLTPEQIEPAIRTTNEWDPLSRVIALENTTNKGGGACYSKEELTEIRKLADRHNLAVHLDGARIWNAMAATGIDASFFGSIADTISICFSKGLGAPVGSMMLCSREQKKKARRYRKMWGGGMRQVGLLAAAADYAVENHLPLLKKDHERARQFAETVHRSSHFNITMETVESNIVLFDTIEKSAKEWVEVFTSNGIGVVPFGQHTVRATFHFQITDDQYDQLLSTVSEL
ncbi:aminotransferase class I/II-fold pyridoxal phosphate-dependent enzyme [Rhodohalobacter sp. SW132]|uniref:threonine aldolase family protein n=1 Tax=Rhodohalobacter sp. SW132 TaxID=2293433 RepID=UPI000E251E5B|nr:GntG family PLP-dependent aldolase [Rhodohalobacter sp. SW132]REL38173.1 aminotransferase class I/II-fold pyridoxal phosphate-dependent enzyme [Rhodohalobacter sp. SW132]